MEHKKIEHFNTSHVSINPMRPPLLFDLSKLFQYISCFY